MLHGLEHTLVVDGVPLQVEAEDAAPVVTRQQACTARAVLHARDAVGLYCQAGTATGAGTVLGRGVTGAPGGGPACGCSAGGVWEHPDVIHPHCSNEAKGSNQRSA
jgi:hypothetical protein